MEGRSEMTVAELMKQLSQQSPEAEVVVMGYGFGLDSVQSVEASTFVRDYHAKRDFGMCGAHAGQHDGYAKKEGAPWEPCVILRDQGEGS